MSYFGYRDLVREISYNPKKKIFVTNIISKDQIIKMIKIVLLKLYRLTNLDLKI